MAEKTGIAWCDSTFNPWIGCTKVGPGCDHCYAEALDKRMRYGRATHWGAGVTRLRTVASNWQGPVRWNAARGRALLAGDGAVPPHRVFCASLADVFDNEVPQAWRDDLWALVAATPHLEWLLVTKRIGNVERMAPSGWIEDGFPSNVRLLITVVNQEEADRDVPKLLGLPCRNGISYEPALGPVDWLPWLAPKFVPTWEPGHVPTDEDFDAVLAIAKAGALKMGRRFIDWLIVGGESGGGARSFDVSWATFAIAQCRVARVPLFIKQLGAKPGYFGPAPFGHTPLVLKHVAGAVPDEWPKALRVQEFPV